MSESDQKSLELYRIYTSLSLPFVQFILSIHHVFKRKIQFVKRLLWIIVVILRGSYFDGRHLVKYVSGVIKKQALNNLYQDTN